VSLEPVMSGVAVRGSVQRLAAALLDDVERIAGLSVARMQELLPSYAKVPADALIPVTLTNTRNLLEAVCDSNANQDPADDHFRQSGETRLSQGITADEMLQAWRIGLEVVREEAHPVAKRLEVTDAALLEFVEASLRWGDVGMRRSAAAHREGEIRELGRLAADQSALHRVAELVARQAPPDEVFAAVTEELSELLGVDMIRTVRFEPDGSATVVAALGMVDDPMPPGTNAPIPAGSVIDQVSRTSRPARVDDYATVGGAVATRLHDEGGGSAVGGPIVVDGRPWGAMVACKTAGTLPAGTEDRVARFAELASIAISNLESRAKVERLVAEQSALRRVAELVARQAPSEEVFAVVTRELCKLLDVELMRTVRFEPDGTATVLAAEGIAKDLIPPGTTNIALPRGTVIEQVFRTRRPARVDDYAQVDGPIGALLREERARSGAGGPIVVDGRLWGAMAVGSRTTLPPGSEDRVARFAELVSTAISNVESRAEVERLAAEQAALRRVAELVARQAGAERVFAVVTEELSRVLGADLMVRTARFEPDGTATILAARGVPADLLPTGVNVPRPGRGILDQVLRTGRPGRVDDYAQVSGPVAVDVRHHGIRSAAAGPIIVDGRTWGAMAVGSQGSLPSGIEHRVAQFAELVSTAISNIESRAKVERLAGEQSALRRVATLVARSPASARLFSIVAREVASVLNVSGMIVQRYEADGTVVTVGEAFASDLAGAERIFAVGSRMPPDPGSLAAQVFETQRPARVDDFSSLPGTVGELARAAGLGSGVAGPIVVDGALWGKMCVFSAVGAVLPVGMENRLHEFVELIATAIANYEARAELATSEARARGLAEEQAALRRVAMLVARGVQPLETFSAVCEEVGRVFGSPYAGIARFELDGSGVVIVGLSEGISNIPIGTRWPLEEFLATTIVYRTGRPARNERSGWEDTSGPVADRLRELGLVSTVAAPIVVEGNLWGLITVSDARQRLPPDTEQRLAAFTELVATAIANAESRAELAASEARARELAEEQAALRRVAVLVAEGAPPNRVLDAVRDEVEQTFGIPNTVLMRFDPNRMATLLATPGDYLGPVGKQWPLEGDDSAVAGVYRTGGAARADYTAGATGTLAQAARRGGTVFPVAVPVMVAGAMWGAMSVGSRGPHPPPPDLEGRLAKFTELLGTAIANAEGRADLAASEAHAHELASEQAALRRVATIVAQGASPDELFSAITKEVGLLLEVDAASILRYEADSTTTVVTGWSDGAIELPVGARLPLEGENLAAEVLRTGKPQRKDEYSGARGRIASTVRELGLTSAVASPIVVEGAIWGVIGVLSRTPKSLPADTEERLTEFSRVAGMAVANAKNQSDLAQSRARIVRAGDEARRRFERDLHDGAQQRLVSLGLELRAAEASVPAELADVQRALSGLGAGLGDVLDDLRELSRGLHPAVLSEDGLSPALRALALRSAVPVDLRIDIEGDRFEEPVEVAAYYVASEALTNTAKHGDASRAEVAVGRRDGWLELIVTDDGKGGADASAGSGLTGLVDRVEAIGGSIQIDSSAEAGTAIYVKLPIGPSEVATRA
jgi:GAF domain-containing protein